jgi:hypothetical protein
MGRGCAGLPINYLHKLEDGDVVAGIRILLTIEPHHRVPLPRHNPHSSDSS